MFINELLKVGYSLMLAKCYDNEGIDIQLNFNINFTL